MANKQSDFKTLNILLFIVGNVDDYLTSDIIEGLVELEDENRVRLYAYCFPHFIVGNGIQHKHMVNKKFINERLQSIDHILIFSQNPYFPSHEKTLDNSPFEILNTWNVWEKCAYIDGTEYNWHSKPCIVPNKNRPRSEPFNFTYMLEKCKYYFKRECYPEDVKAGIIPLPFAYSLKRRFISEKYITNNNKNIDIFCSFPQNFTGMRYEVSVICDKISKSNSGVKVDMSNDLWYEEYCNRISQSYISIDACGGGQINARPWEIIANGSVLFRQKYDVIVPNDFIVKGENKEENLTENKTEMIVEYKDIDDFLTKLSTYLNDKERLLQMRDRAFKHLMKFHTCRARVEYLLSKFDIRVKIEQK